MIVIAAIIIFLGLVAHACINYKALLDIQELQRIAQFHIQQAHHHHEVEFAKQQAELFRSESKKKVKQSDPVITTKVIDCSKN